MDMHRATGLVLHRFGHERGEAAVFQGRFTYQTFVEKYLVGQRNRVTVFEIDLDLPGATFLDDRIDLESLCFGKIVNVIDHRAVFFDSRHAVSLPSYALTAGPADRWLHRVVRIYVWLGQIELKFRGYHWSPIMRLVCSHNRFKYVAWRDRYG